MTDLQKKCRVINGKYRNAQVKTTESGALDLVLSTVDGDELIESLPTVSIVTITRDRGEFAWIMLNNWVNIKYPREKLEWIILDDSQDRSEYNLADYIPQDDPAIKYYHLSTPLRVCDKRNAAVELASNEIIIHMDDDDYYFADGVLAKVRVILEYKCQGVLSNPIGVYDMTSRKSYITMDGNQSKIKKNTNMCSEASFAYRREYWERHKFYSTDERGTNEGISFIGKRFHDWVNLHFLFNMISITHAKNTSRSRPVEIDDDGDENVGDFEKVFPESFNVIVDNVRKILAINEG